MKTLRILAIVPLALISLMNLGAPAGSDMDLAVDIAAVAMGVAGLAAVAGLVRTTSWGIPAALAVAGVNVIAALIALVNDAEGAAIGLVVSSLALALAFAASASRRRGLSVA